MTLRERVCNDSVGQTTALCQSRAKYGKIVEKCRLLCNELEKLGHQCEVDAQDMLARLTLDVILMAGFGLESNTIADHQSVPLLQELHYAMDESFRCA